MLDWAIIYTVTEPLASWAFPARFLARDDAADVEVGSPFVERMLSVVATARQQNRNVLELLTACCRARLDGSAVPSLLPAQAELVAA